MNIGQFAEANLSEGYFKIRRHSNRADGLGESRGVQSQMTDDSDNRRPRWPNFEQYKDIFF